MLAAIYTTVIIALYIRLYTVKQERNQYKNTLLMNQKERQTI